VLLVELAVLGKWGMLRRLMTQGWRQMRSRLMSLPLRMRKLLILLAYRLRHLVKLSWPSLLTSIKLLFTD
tara:strand:- start:1236 stop:1445 length:210 start_codon:yes stop_codon:yes gene_type:complete